MPKRRSESSARGWGTPGSFNEAFRVLRSNLAVSLSDLERPTVVVTSANAEEGKTVVCCALATSFASSGQRVVLVDLDLRHPSAHRSIGAHNDVGVSDVLLGRRTLEDCLQYIDVGGRSGPTARGFYFLGTGPTVPDPTELLGLGRTAQLLERLARQADLVLLDTPPVLPVADTLVIGRMVAGALLVVEARGTSVTAVQRSKDLLIRNQTRLLGIVMNKFAERDAELASNGYGYGYGYGYGAVAAPEGDDEEDLWEGGEAPSATALATAGPDQAAHGPGDAVADETYVDPPADAAVAVVAAVAADDAVAADEAVASDDAVRSDDAVASDDAAAGDPPADDPSADDVAAEIAAAAGMAAGADDLTAATVSVGTLTADVAASSTNGSH